MKFSKQIQLKLKYKVKKSKHQISRNQIKGTFKSPRLSVYRSNKNIYAQIINDDTSNTLIAYSTLDHSFKSQFSTGKTCKAAWYIGEKLAKLSLKKNITKIIFDRRSYLYHGRIKALAEGARSGGLKF